MTKLVAATNNRHKLVEIRNILTPKGIEILSAADVGGVPDVEENGETFEENAIIKATAAAAHTGLPVIADDSGLEVFALGGEPGVYSARYAGEGATDEDRMAKLLKNLVNEDDRSARFVCVIALAKPGNVIGTVEGEVRGSIGHTPIGSNGFGYDPLFIPDGYDKTFAELESDEKDSISHRGNALQALIDSDLLAQL